MLMLKKLMMILLVLLLLATHNTPHKIGASKRPYTSNAEQPTTNSFAQSAELIIPGESVFYLEPTKRHIIAVARVGEILSRKYSLRCLNISKLEEIWEITELDRFTMEISEKYVAIGADTTGFLKIIDIDNGNILLDTNLGEDINSLCFVDSYLFATTPTRIVVYDDFQRFWKELKNDGYWIDKSSNSRIFLGNRDVGLKCVDYMTGECKWVCNFKLKSFWGVNLVGENIITASQDNELVAINKLTGEFVWKANYNKNEVKLRQFPRIFEDNHLFITNSLDGSIMCINLHDGSIEWERNNFNLDFQRGLAIYRDRLYATIDSYLYSIDKTNGNVLSKTNLFHKIWTFVFTPGAGCVVVLPDQNFDSQECKIYLYSPTIPETLTYNLDKTIFISQNVEYYMDVKATIVNGSTFMSARYLLEPLGGEVSWSQKDKKVTCTLNNDTKNISIELQINNPKASLNGKQVQIDPKNPKITPIILNSRTMVPLRFLAESLGCKVEWKADKKEITVTYAP